MPIPKNQLAKHIRLATHSPRIPRTHRTTLTRPISGLRKLPVAGGRAGMFGLGSLGTKVPGPADPKLLRPHTATLALPLDHRLKYPATNRVSPGYGNMIPGLGFMEELAGVAAAHRPRLRPAMRAPSRAPVMVATNQPRVLGSSTRSPEVHGGFMPGLGLEADGDMLALGYLTAPELAADDVPTVTNPAATAAVAGASAMGKLMLIAGLAFAAGIVLRMR